MKNNSDFLNNIIKKLDTIRNNEFQLQNYVPIEVVLKKKVHKINEVDTNVLKKEFRKMTNNFEKRMEKRGLKNKQLVVEDNNHDIIMDKDIFNIVKDESKLIQWKNIEINKKEELLKNFINKKFKDFPENLFKKIIDLIKKNKINFKKYINYDPISEVVIDLPIIYFDEIENKYKLNYSNTKKIKRKKITFK